MQAAMAIEVELARRLWSVDEYQELALPVVQIVA